MTVQTIALKPIYNLLFNNMTKTVLLSQLVYWDGRKSLLHEGKLWFAKTSEALADEIGHPSAKSIGNWLREFKEMGIITTTRKFFDGINQIWMSVDHAKIRELLVELGADLSLLDNKKISPTDDSNILETEVTTQSESPQTELNINSNIPETELTDMSNLPQTELSHKVTSLTGNSITKNSFQKESDQDQKDLIQRSDLIDDDNFIQEHLSQSQIAEVTQRVNQQIAGRKNSDNPIRNKACYLKMALKNEAEKSAATKTKTTSLMEYALNHQDLEEPEPYRAEPRCVEFPVDEIWDDAVVNLKDMWDEANFTTWIEPSRFESKDDTTYVIAVPNVYMCDMLQYRLYGDVKSALTEAAQQEFEIEFVHRHRDTFPTKIHAVG